MFSMPFQIVGVWLRGLLSVVLIAGGIWLLSQSFRHREVVVVTHTPPVAQHRDPQQKDTHSVPRSSKEQPNIIVRSVPWQMGLNRQTGFLAGGVALLIWSFAGQWLVSPLWLRRVAANEPQSVQTRKSQRLRLNDGSELSVQSFGAADGEPVILTHGWGLNSDEWFYAKKELTGGRRLVVWDLPGLGQSDRPVDRDWSLERLAGDLHRVIEASGNKPVVLVGHSIGVMIVLTYCKLFPASLGKSVRGLVLAQSTYTNPVRTTHRASLYTALENPVLKPLCYLMIWLSPFVRVLNWLSYLNGSAHRSTERDSFSGNESRGQLKFLTRCYIKAAPDVVGRGMLAMLKYDATDFLSKISIPTLVVAGDEDKTCLPEASLFMAETIPNATLVTLGQSKHCGLFEHHREFHAAVTQFLQTLPPVPEASAASVVFPASSPAGREGVAPMTNS